MTDRYISSISRWALTDKRSFVNAITQAGKPVLDADLNILAATADASRFLAQRSALSSGFIREPGRKTALSVDYTFPLPGDPLFAVNCLYFNRQMAMVAGYPVEIAGTNVTTELNKIRLDAAPDHAGPAPNEKRTDFVFLECWLAEVSASPQARWTIEVASLPAAATTLTFTDTGAHVLTAVAGAPVGPQFQIGVSTAATATNIAAALIANYPTYWTATATGNIVTVTAIPSGIAGNAYTIVSSTVAMVVTQVQVGVDTNHKPTQDTVWRYGNTLGNLANALPEQLRDDIFRVETTKRVQLQYRIRHTGQDEDVDWQTESDGYSNPLVYAQGGQTSPVVGYPFVKADNLSVSASSDATIYGFKDPGLWIAGDGSATAAGDLDCVDGFVYSIPVCLVARRNDAWNTGGWDPVNNTAGAVQSTNAGYVSAHTGLVIPATKSDRPDGAFCDVIRIEDVVDLRMTTPASQLDLANELHYQVQKLLDGQNRGSLADSSLTGTVGTGSGDLANRPLVCDEIGRDVTKGGVAPSSGTTGRGTVIRNLDHMARTFSDSPVIERVIIPVNPSAANPAGITVTNANVGYAGWAETDTIEINLDTLQASTLADWSGAASYPGPERVSDFAPIGTVITDVLSCYFDDGNWFSAATQATQLQQVKGLNTRKVTLTLDPSGAYMTGGIQSHNGTALAGGLATIDLAVTASAVNNIYNGFYIQITAGTGAGQTRRVSAYNGAIKQATVAVNWGPAPDNTSVYRIVYAATGDAVYDTGSPRRIFVELEVQYPVGQGLTRSVEQEIAPSATIWTQGVVLENNTAQRSLDFEALVKPKTPSRKREARLEFVANSTVAATPYVDTVVSRTNQIVILPRRIYGSAAAEAALLVTDQETLLAVAVVNASNEYGSSTRHLATAVASGAQTLEQVSWFPQEALPNSGNAGYQVSLYYQSVPPQTHGLQAGAAPWLPSPMTVTPLTMPQDISVFQGGIASVAEQYPHLNASEWIPVLNDVAVLGDHYFAANVMVETLDFNAAVGVLNLPTYVRMHTADNLVLSGVPDFDQEMRSYYPATTGSYLPSAMGKPLVNSSVHKNAVWMLVQVLDDTFGWRAGEVLLLCLSGWTPLSSANEVKYLGTGNKACGSLYRLEGRPLLNPSNA